MPGILNKIMMKRVLLIIIPVALIVLVATRLINNKDIAEERVYVYDKEQPIRIKADTIKQVTVEMTLSHIGTFEPYMETKISAENQGKINAVLVDIGSEVKKGQRLIELDNSLLKLELESTKVKIEGLEADVKRYSILANADAIQGVQLEKAGLGLKSARLQQAMLQEKIKKTNIRAPFDGVVTAKFAEVGGFAAPGIPLLQITDINKLRFTVNVPEKELTTFRIGKDYNLHADILPAEKLTGKTIMIGSKAGQGNNFTVQLLVKNTPDLEIKSGMFGTLQMTEENIRKRVIPIPASAVQGTANNPQVYLIKNGRALLTNVSISSRTGNKVLVAQGLKEGDIIVTSGFINLFDNAPVTFR